MDSSTPQPPPIPRDEPGFVPGPPSPLTTLELTPGPTVAVPERRLRWLFRPIRLEQCGSGWRFIRRILVQQFAVKIAVSIPVGILLHGDASNGQEEMLKEPLFAFVVMVLLAPPIETLIFQSAPIEFLRTLRRSRRLQFLLGSVPFAAAHFPAGAAVGIGAGVVGGIFFSYTYLEGRARSLWSALWMTTVTHALHNLIVLPLALMMVH